MFASSRLLLFAVEHPLLGPFLAVVNDDLVVCTRGYDALPIIAGGINLHQIRNQKETLLDKPVVNVCDLLRIVLV